MRPAPVPQTSAGGVVVRRVGDRSEVCLILRTRYGRRAWCLPKGHVEAGEDPPTAALREVQEETGLVCEILSPLGTTAYQFTEPGAPAPFAKTVWFFLMRARAGDLARHDAEALEVRWMALDEALGRATYDSEQRIIEQGKRELSRPAVAARIGDAADS